MKKFNSTEMCPHCDTEQTVTAIVQECPNCKKPLVACSMCVIYNSNVTEDNCDGCTDGSKFKYGELETYNIEVCRIGYSFKTIEVDATSQKEAEELALDEAGSHEFSEKDAEYKIS